MDKNKTVPVRIDAKLIPLMRKLIFKAQDEFHLRKFSSLSDVATEGVKQLLRQHNEIPQEHPPPVPAVEVPAR